jgi:antitoxin (DNA-binding transcriptional repressor) of toxin-antitoxin stability system
MRTVAIGVLKNQLSAYLHRVRAGEEIIVRDRQTPIARIIPMGPTELDDEERELVTQGLLIPAKQKFDYQAFASIGAGMKRKPGTKAALDRAMEWVRSGSGEESDVNLLGRERPGSRVRSRAKK